MSFYIHILLHNIHDLVPKDTQQTRPNHNHIHIQNHINLHPLRPQILSHFNFNFNLFYFFYLILFYHSIKTKPC